MSRKKNLISLVSIVVFAAFSFRNIEKSKFEILYFQKVSSFIEEEKKLISEINSINIIDTNSTKKLIFRVEACRRKLKCIDFWLRYLEPNIHKKLNGPLPVEWETEVFEKNEKPHRREGAGLGLTEIHLNKENPSKDSLLSLTNQSLNAVTIYLADSITQQLQTPDVFFFCNRLYLLNLATIYTTGFECPNQKRVIVELQNMLEDVTEIYTTFNESFPQYTISENYITLYNKTIAFVKTQPKDYTLFNHYLFIKNYINPLFEMNQQFIASYDVYTKSNVDFSLNNQTNSIFDKALFYAQNTKGIYSNISDDKILNEIDSIGKLLFYDPILSENNLRSCASCHKPKEHFTDTTIRTAIQFNKNDVLPRNTPSLINAPFNHLLMLDGKLNHLQQQFQTVTSNPIEMGSNNHEILKKVLSCATYKTTFQKLLTHTPSENEININHISSAVTFYYSKFSQYYSPFDESINKSYTLEASAIEGFNIFMSKAQCATCHFLPTFSGIKPPFVSNEFEVIGVPNDTNFKKISPDKGRYLVNPASETINAFRTNTIRNTAKTKPYMHNGVFNTMNEVINFYNNGGGNGHHLQVSNQTLSEDSLQLTEIEKKQLISFVNSLNENIKFESSPTSLPKSTNSKLNKRKVGGEY